MESVDCMRLGLLISTLLMISNTARCEWLNLTALGPMAWHEAELTCQSKQTDCRLPSSLELKELILRYSDSGKYQPPQHLYPYSFWSKDVYHYGCKNSPFPSDDHLYDTAQVLYGFNGRLYPVKLDGADYGNGPKKSRVFTLCLCASDRVNTDDAFPSKQVDQYFSNEE